MRKNLHIAKWALLNLTILFSLSAMAKGIDEETARQKAVTFMQKKFGMGQGAKMRHVAIDKMTTSARFSAVNANGNQPIYIFNREGGGYVIVSGDDRTFDILGYGYTGEIDPETMPANMKEWIGAYCATIANLDGHEYAIAPRTPSKVKAEIKPRMMTTWNQSDPYNRRAPYYTYTVDGVTHSEPAVTGCTATALAQVMYYYRYPDAVQEDIPGYDGKFDLDIDDNTVEATYTVAPVAAGTPIDWDNMLLSYEENGTYNATQVDAVANLMQYLGAAFKMNYGPESGATPKDVVVGTFNAFGYKDAYYISASSYDTYEEWADRVYEELAAAEVVAFGGQSLLGGHMFVLDGYEGEDYFHVNWGWGGVSDGYFKLSIMDPTGLEMELLGYNTSQHFIGGLGPNGKGKNVITPRFECITMTIGKEGQTYEADPNNQDDTYLIDFRISYGNFAFPEIVANSGIGIKYYDASEPESENWSLGVLKRAVFPLKMLNIEILAGQIGLGNIDDGIYIIKPFCSPEDKEDEWLPMYNADPNTAYLIVHDGKATVSYDFDTAVAITAPQIAKQMNEDTWRTVDGRVLSGRPTSPGIYIRGGKKIFVKNGQDILNIEKQTLPVNTTIKQTDNNLPKIWIHNIQ